MRPHMPPVVHERRMESRSASRFTGRRVHFIGIGGCGMSGLASMLLDNGAIVSGSEPKFNPQTAELVQRGAKITRDQLGEALARETNLVVRSAAVPDSNLEFKAAQRYGIDTINDLNRLHHKQIRDPEIASRISTYELAFRMQSAAPELIDLSRESKATLEAYGINREDPKIKTDRGGGPGQFRAFARNCLLARRLVERGVRFVNLYHASWDHHSNLDAELVEANQCDQAAVLPAAIESTAFSGLSVESRV